MKVPVRNPSSLRLVSHQQPSGIPNRFVIFPIKKSRYSSCTETSWYTKHQPQKRSCWLLMTYHGVTGSAFFFAGQGMTWSRGQIQWGTFVKTAYGSSLTKSSCRTAQRGHTKHLLPTSTNRRLSQNRLASRMSSSLHLGSILLVAYLSTLLINDKTYFQLLNQNSNMSLQIPFFVTLAIIYS